jgi:hypothetical protein
MQLMVSRSLSSGAHSRDPLAPAIALDLVDDAGGGEIRGHAEVTARRPTISREILTATDSTEFCRDSNQCLLPGL